MHVWPAFMVAACQIERAASATSASAITSALSRPLSSSVVGVRVRAHCAAISRPTAVDPVKTTWSKRRVSRSRRPASRVASSSPIDDASSPAPPSASIASSTRSRCDDGARSLGFTVVRFPAITPCASWIPRSCSG